MLSKYPDSLEELIEFLRFLPGIGKRSAERMALHLLSWDEEKLLAFGEVLTRLPKRLTRCENCGNLAERTEKEGERSLCGICSSPARDQGTICVVEEFTQIRSIESSSVYRGLYHVLGGRIAPLEGKGVESIDVEGLEKRLACGGIKEVILALSNDVEGEATSLYLAERLGRNKEIRITLPARGLPAGSNLSYADPATIAAALSNRAGLPEEK